MIIIIIIIIIIYHHHHYYYYYYYYYYNYYYYYYYYYLLLEFTSLFSQFFGMLSPLILGSCYQSSNVSALFSQLGRATTFSAVLINTIYRLIF